MKVANFQKYMKGGYIRLIIRLLSTLVQTSFRNSLQIETLKKNIFWIRFRLIASKGPQADKSTLFDTSKFSNMYT